eukprot:scaffold1874_cov109-Isochrysis_galbana.AAC.4
MLFSACRALVLVLVHQLLPKMVERGASQQSDGGSKHTTACLAAAPIDASLRLRVFVPAECSLQHRLKVIRRRDAGRVAKRRLQGARSLAPVAVGCGGGGFFQKVVRVGVHILVGRVQLRCGAIGEEGVLVGQVGDGRQEEVRPDAELLPQQLCVLDDGGADDEPPVTGSQEHAGGGRVGPPYLVCDEGRVDDHRSEGAAQIGGQSLRSAEAPSSRSKSSSRQPDRSASDSAKKSDGVDKKAASSRASPEAAAGRRGLTRPAHPHIGLPPPAPPSPPAPPLAPPVPPAPPVLRSRVMYSRTTCAMVAMVLAAYQY